jgi:hypothetical protein
MLADNFVWIVCVQDEFPYATRRDNGHDDRLSAALKDLEHAIVSLRFIGPDVAIAETLTSVSGFPKTGPPPGVQTDANGRLRTRLLQVLKKDGGKWMIVVYHNVDVKPGVAVPEPR